MHPVQQRILQEVAMWTGAPAGRIPLMVDGCGVVAFGLALDAMAASFARLGAAAEEGEELASRVVGALRHHPFLVGGTDRFDTVIIEETAGDVVTKVGAEGVHCGFSRSGGFAFALKVEDGAQRAQYTATLRLLQTFGALPETLPDRLGSFLRAPVLNTRGEQVGEVGPLE